MTSLTGKRALVTGATSGLGRAMAAALVGPLPGGATATGMIPGRRLRPVPCGTTRSGGDVHDERIAATEFAGWLAQRQR